MKQPLFQRTHVETRGSNYIGTFRNTKKAHKLVAGLSVLFAKWGRVYKQGRNPNRKKLVAKTGKCHSDLRRGVPIPFSTHFDVYLDRKQFPSSMGRQHFWGRELDGIPAVHLMIAEMVNE